MIPGINNQTYHDLMLHFLPRPVTNETEYKETQTEIDQLLDKHDLTPDEQDYLHVLGTLISDYEAHTEDTSAYELRGVALMRGLLELHGMRQKDLAPIFKTKSIVSDVLNGKRKLTVEHINLLAAFFSLPHEAFFEPINFSEFSGRYKKT